MSLLPAGSFSTGAIVPRSGAAERRFSDTVRGNRNDRPRAIFCRVLAGLGALLWTVVAGVAAAAEVPREALRARIESLRSAGDARIGAGSAAARAVLAAVYERRGFAPLWDEPQRAQALLAAIAASHEHGLEPRDYPVEPAVAGAAPAQAVERELTLTDAFMRLAYHLHFGKADPRHLQRGWNFSRTLAGADPVAALQALLAEPDPAQALDRLAPQLPAYRGLRQVLAQLRRVGAGGGWPRVGDGPRLEHGATGPRVQQLRARLRASGDLDDGGDDAAFDEALAAAVRRFQSRHGLDADGVVGRATLAALNVPAAERIAQLRANLERLRWVARDLAGDYLLVDIAGFSAQL